MKVAVVLTLAAILRNGQLHLEKIFTTGQRSSSSRDPHLPLVIGTIGELHGNTNRQIFLANGHGI